MMKRERRVQKEEVEKKKGKKRMSLVALFYFSLDSSVDFSFFAMQYKNTEASSPVVVFEPLERGIGIDVSHRKIKKKKNEI